MTKSLNALAFAVVFGVLTALPAAAQGVTISGCSSPSWDPATSTLACGGGGSGPPSCTISGNANGTTGVADNLTANCAPAATSWSWTGGSCAGGTAQTCAANEGLAGLQTYKVTGTNVSGGTGAQSAGFNVTWFSVTGPPQGCAIAPSGQTVGSTGGAIIPLVVTCAGGAPLTSWAWSRSGNCGGTSALSSTATQTDNMPANTLASGLSCTYTANVSNGSGSASPSPTAAVSVNGKVSVIDCKSSPQAASLGITGSTTTIQLPWVIDSANTLLTGNGTYPVERPNMALVGVIQVPLGSTSTQFGRINIHEYGSAPIHRLVTLSKTPCSWGSPSDGTGFTSYQLDPNFYFTVGPNTAGYAQMQPGETWYVNIVMQDPGKTPPQGEQCKSGSSSQTCNFVIEFFKPSGT